MADEGSKRGRPPKDPLLSGYGETKLLSVKVPEIQYERLMAYIHRRFEDEGIHLGVSDVVRHALVRLGINGIAEGAMVKMAAREPLLVDQLDSAEARLETQIDNAIEAEREFRISLDPER